MHTSMHRQLYQLHHCDKSTVHSTCIETGCYANQGVAYFHHVGIAPNHTAISSQLHSCSLGSGNVPAWVLVVAQEVCDVYWLRWVLPGMRPKESLPDYLRHLGTTSPPKLSLHMYMYLIHLVTLQLWRQISTTSHNAVTLHILQFLGTATNLVAALVTPGDHHARAVCMLKGEINKLQYV